MNQAACKSLLQRLILLLVPACFSTGVFSQTEPAIHLNFTQLKQVATIDPRFLSYNIEMVEVVGGRFWIPY
ncbi:MAG TPA: hypothetical protein VG842_07330, partial [Sediminibacterium sp.]|nr:hypothetical protein [Sediminibacterium sp.]